MKAFTRLVVAFLFTHVSLIGPALACSAFFVNAPAQMVFAKSYDWDVGHGMVLINKRNVQKKALSLFGGKVAEWVSKYGSLTFNQHGLDFPLGGINEAGLAIEILWLPITQFPDPDSLPSVNEAQWIQFHLDQAGSVEELIRLAKTVVIDPVFAKTHYMACDKTGACAGFEFLAGQLVVHRMNEAVMTNTDYKTSMDYLAQHKGFGGNKTVSMSGYDSKDRFVRLAALKRQLSQMTDINQLKNASFDLLMKVRSNSRTRWQITYDLNSKKVSFRRIDTGGTAIKDVDFKKFDLNCQTPVMSLDLDAPGSGDRTLKFVPLTPEANKAMVRRSAKALGLPESIADAVSDHAFTTSACR